MICPHCGNTDERMMDLGRQDKLVVLVFCRVCSKTFLHYKKDDV